MAWTTPRTWVPGEFVTASMLNTHLRDNELYLYGAARTAIYPATLADVINTAAETLAASFAIPADAMSNGDLISAFISMLIKNNKGSDGTATAKVNVGAGVQVTVNWSASLASNDANEYTVAFGFVLQRMGSTVIVRSGSGFTGLTNNPWNTIGATPSTPANFTSAQTVSLKITLNAASSLFYVKPQTALIVHLKN